MYKLTEHKGIKYFSYTFLFFGIAHLFRFLFRIFFRYFFDIPKHLMFNRMPHLFGGWVFVYTSVMAGLFLLYSVMYKKIKLKETTIILLINVIAIITTLLDMWIKNPFVHVGIITTIFGATIIVSLTKKSKKRHPFFIAYISIFLIWLLNLISIEIPKFMFELRVGIYVMSLVLYFVILQRIFKKRKK